MSETKKSTHEMAKAAGIKAVTGCDDTITYACDAYALDLFRRACEADFVERMNGASGRKETGVRA